MPGNVDEKDWEKAKKLASEQGKEDIYPYVMGIYNRIHEHSHNCQCNHLEEEEGTTISSDFGDSNRPENVLSVAKIGLHNRPKPKRKPKSKKVNIDNMFEPTPKYERYFEEDDWGNDTVTPSKFVEQVLDEEALKEFNIQQWSKHISAFTNKHKNIRKKTVGEEKRVAKLVDYYFGRNIVVMKTVPTFFVPNDGYDNKNNKWKSYTRYTVMIEFTNINEYLKKAREKSGRTINVWNLSETTFRRLIKASNIKVDCSDASYNFQGKRYRATQVNSSIYPQTIPDPVWRSVHGSSDYLCKHLASIIPLIEKSAGKILKLIQKKKLEGRSPAPIKAKRK